MNKQLSGLQSQTKKKLKHSLSGIVFLRCAETQIKHEIEYLLEFDDLNSICFKRLLFESKTEIQEQNYMEKDQYFI